MTATLDDIYDLLVSWQGTDTLPKISTDAQDLSAKTLPDSAGVTRLVAGLVPLTGALTADCIDMNTLSTDLPLPDNNEHRGVLVFTSGVEQGHAVGVIQSSSGQLVIYPGVNNWPATGDTFVLVVASANMVGIINQFANDGLNVRVSGIVESSFDSSSLSAIAAAVLGGIVEGGLTLKKVLRLCLAVLANKASGGGTTHVAFRDLADSRDRVAMTVGASGDRISVAVDGDD
jgi:hypothetical protein